MCRRRFPKRLKETRAHAAGVSTELDERVVRDAPSQPVQINFEILYQVVGGRWRLFGIAVTPSQAAPPSESAPG